MNVFGYLERGLAMLYPYRVPLALLAIAIVAAAVWYARQHGWWGAIARRRTRALVVAGALTVVAVPAGAYLLSPLWTRTTLVEVSPVATAPAATEAARASTETARTSTAVTGPRITRRGEWQGADEFHFARGHALLIETEPGRYSLRLEQFSVRNGPDLFVYLSPAAAGYAQGAINLGSLKATDGAFNYEIPPGTDVEQFKSAVVWCRQFTVQFGHAPLQ